MGQVQFLTLLTFFCHRPIKGIKGLTREVVVAITTHIESQEFRRHYGEEKLLPPEHPREERLDRVTISRRADPGVFVANRAVIPQRGQLTVCAAHLRSAENLPPADQQHN